MPGTGILSAMAFHEKAGRSQVDLFVFSLEPAAPSIATLPSALLVKRSAADDRSHIKP